MTMISHSHSSMLMAPCIQTPGENTDWCMCTNRKVRRPSDTTNICTEKITLFYFRSASECGSTWSNGPFQWYGLLTATGHTVQTNAGSPSPCALCDGIQIQWKPFWDCQPALSTEWLDWVANSCELWRMRKLHPSMTRVTMAMLSASNSINFKCQSLYEFLDGSPALRQINHLRFMKVARKHSKRNRRDDKRAVGGCHVQSDLNIEYLCHRPKKHQCLSLNEERKTLKSKGVPFMQNREFLLLPQRTKTRWFCRVGQSFITGLPKVKKTNFSKVNRRN